MIWSTFQLNKKENKTQPIHIMLVVLCRNFPLWISCLFIMILKMLFSSPSFPLLSHNFRPYPSSTLYIGELFKIQESSVVQRARSSCWVLTDYGFGRACLASPPASSHVTWFSKTGWVRSALVLEQHNVSTLPKVSVEHILSPWQLHCVYLLSPFIMPSPEPHILTWNIWSPFQKVLCG